MSEADLQEQIKWLKNELNRIDRREYAMANTYGWIGGAWQKNPILDGYSGDVTETKSNTSASAGANTLTSTAVPAGEIWRLQAVNAVNYNSAAGVVVLYVNVNSTNIVLTYNVAPAVNVHTIWTGEIRLSEGDTVRADFSSCTLNDDIYMYYHAVRVDIDQ